MTVRPAEIAQRVDALRQGEAVVVPGGARVWRLAAEDGTDRWATEEIGAEDCGRGHRMMTGTVELALSRAMTISARSTDPASLGGAQALPSFGPATIGGRPVRLRGFLPDGQVEYVPAPASSARLSPTLAREPRSAPASRVTAVREALDESDELAEAEAGKPGTNFTQVTPENRARIEPIVRHYRRTHPGGAGLYRACMTADTPVDAPRDLERQPDGVPISELRPGDLVWSFDEHRREFCLRPVAWAERTRKDAELLAVTIDNGRTVRCTPDHPFLLRDGRWREAGELRPGDSLMPLYRDFAPRVRLRPDAIGYTQEHAEVARAVHGEMDGRHVHHDDYRRANVAPSNLLALTGNEHAQVHHDGFAEAAALRDEWWRCRACEEMFTPTMRNQRLCAGCRATGGYVKRVVGHTFTCDLDGCEVEYVATSGNQRFCSTMCRDEAGRDAKNAARRERRRAAREAPATWNHRVMDVRPLPEREDVWDIEVEDTHTFVVHGVVVHNCVRDNRKRFGPRTEQVCAVVKDMAMGTTKWRAGGKGRQAVTERELVAEAAGELLEVTEGLGVEVLEQGLRAEVGNAQPLAEDDALGMGPVEEAWGPEARAKALAARMRKHPDWNWGGKDDPDPVVRRARQMAGLDRPDGGKGKGAPRITVDGQAPPVPGTKQRLTRDAPKGATRRREEQRAQAKREEADRLEPKRPGGERPDPASAFRPSSARQSAQAGARFDQSSVRETARRAMQSPRNDDVAGARGVAAARDDLERREARGERPKVRYAGAPTEAEREANRRRVAAGGDPTNGAGERVANRQAGQRREAAITKQYRSADDDPFTKARDGDSNGTRNARSELAGEYRRLGIATTPEAKQRVRDRMVTLRRQVAEPPEAPEWRGRGGDAPSGAGGGEDAAARRRRQKAEASARYRAKRREGGSSSGAGSARTSASPDGGGEDAAERRRRQKAEASRRYRERKRSGGRSGADARTSASVAEALEDPMFGAPLG